VTRDLTLAASYERSVPVSLAHSTVCPHLGGPLENAPVSDGHLVCPWHGYRFSLADGSNPDGRRCRLAASARVRLSPGGTAELEVS
jgi:nitrite reductase/ring-hydroxylating ferredoxin subunit